ncbi:MAG: hydantoinase/oxoprolinase family protein [Acidimicrobiales bacterium]
MPTRIGCDVGGTFTDFAVLLSDGSLVSAKLLTTPEDPAGAVVHWMESFQADHRAFFEDLSELVHGSTLAINAILERRGARTALVTTRGFGDVLVLRRGRRPDMYDIHNDGASAIVPRRLCVELDERRLADGTEHTALSKEALADTLTSLRALQAESVAVSLLHSYIDPSHERTFGEALAREAPGVAVSLSCEIAPEIKEYERACTTAIDAYVKPIVSGYVGRLETDLHGLAPSAELDLVLSSGSRVTARTAVGFPSRLIESGPAAGVVAAVELARVQGLDRIFAFDMGGTSAKGCIVSGDELPITRDYEVDRSLRFKAGSGLPVNVPTVDLIEIGCGGGSIARLSALGLLTVGPRSAGAKPGPACYGLGGGDPTVTDADVVLGYISVDRFLGGDLPLDGDAAHRSIEQLADLLGLGVDETAWGIHSIANELMANAMKTYAAERGVSLDRVAIAAYGGAGPVHAADMAQRLHGTRVLVPYRAGVASAVGMLMARRSFETVRTYKRRLDAVDPAKVTSLFKELVQEGRAAVGAATEPDVTYYAEVCYVGQGSALMVELPDRPGPGALDGLREQFVRIYASRYGAEDPMLDLELVTLRTVVTARAQPPALAAMESTPEVGLVNEPAEAGSTRRAFDHGSGTFIDFQVFNRSDLANGRTFEGPAIVEERETTTVVPNGWQGSVAGDRTLVLTAPDKGGQRP